MTTQPIIDSPRRPRRARWPWVVLTIVVLLAVLAVVAEFVARAVVPSTVRSVVIEQLDLPADQQLDVQTSGILLPQLLSGALDELRLSSDAVTLGGITGSARVTAQDVPIRGGAFGSAEGEIAIDESQFASLLSTTQLPDAEIALQEPDVIVQGAFPLFGREVPIGLTVQPGADDGDLLLTPISVTVAGEEFDLQRLTSLFGDVGRSLAGPHRVCIADRLPAGLTLTGLRVQDKHVVAEISADGRIAVDDKLRENGTCPR